MAPSLLCAQPVASLADGRTGRIEFASLTPSGPSELVRGAGAPVTVGGTLLLPSTAAARLPAMVIAHGSGGILAGREDAWATRLNSLGIATFVVDSFAPRGLSSTARDQSRLSSMANLPDAVARRGRRRPQLCRARGPLSVLQHSLSRPTGEPRADPDAAGRRRRLHAGG